MLATSQLHTRTSFSVTLLHFQLNWIFNWPLTKPECSNIAFNLIFPFSSYVLPWLCLLVIISKTISVDTGDNEFLYRQAPNSRNQWQAKHVTPVVCNIFNGYFCGVLEFWKKIVFFTHRKPKKIIIVLIIQRKIEKLQKPRCVRDYMWIK